MTSTRPARPSSTRVHNDRMALDLLLRHGPMTAPELATGTGLSRPTISDLLERLQRAELIEMVGQAGATRRGPNARLFGVSGRRAHVIGLDVRSDGVQIALADLTGALVTTREVYLGAEADPAHAIAATLGALKEVIGGDSTVHTVAVGAPGLVDPLTGRLRPRIRESDWHTGLIEELYGEAATVLVENEANLAGIAEHQFGAAQGLDTFVLLWLGEGVGAATVLDGRLRRGASGGAGELGFLPVPRTAGLPSSTDCGGGFHDLASGSAIRALASAHHPIDEPFPVALSDLVHRAVEAGTAGHTFLDHLALNLALGTAAVCAVLDPGHVVLGGPVGRAGGPELAGLVAGHLATLSPLSTHVLSSTVEGNEILRGAVSVALDATRDALFQNE